MWLFNGKQQSNTQNETQNETLRKDMATTTLFKKERIPRLLVELLSGGGRDEGFLVRVLLLLDVRREEEHPLSERELIATGLLFLEDLHAESLGRAGNVVHLLDPDRKISVAYFQ